MLMKVLFTLSTLMVYCQASFYFPALQFRFPEIASAATAQLNSSLIMFGGMSGTVTYLNDLYELTLSNTTFDFQVLPQINRPNGTSFGQAVIVNQQSNMYLLGGVTNSTFEQILPLQIYNYTFATNTWSAFQPSITTALPLNRYLHSLAYDGNRSVYILGGSINATITLSDFYVMDTVTGQFIALPDIPIQICQHSMTYLSSGKIVVIGGTWRLNSSYALDLLPMDSVYVYDIASMQWTGQTVSVVPGQRLPSARANHNTVVSSDNIYVFGGDNARTLIMKAVTISFAVLDTATWTWNSLISNGIPPSRRSYASAGFFGSKYLVTAFGQGIGEYYRDINVYDTSTNSWLISFTPEDAEYGISTGVIAGVVIVCFIVFVCIILVIWKFKSYIRLFFKKKYNSILKPRTGEPLWAEVTRFLFQVFLFFLLTLFLVFVILQVINSPIVTQTINVPVVTVVVPDIRFCLNDIGPLFPESQDFISCSTDTSLSCSNFIIPLNMSIFTPALDGMGDITNCYLFRAPEDYVLTSMNNKNQSKLFFTYYGKPKSSSSSVHMSFYLKEMDPNIRTYQINDSIPDIMSPEDVEKWLIQESSSQQTNVIYNIQPYTSSVVSYNLIDRQYLQPVGWNYVGFLPVTNSTPDIEIGLRSQVPNPRYSALYPDIGVVQIVPSTFTNIIEREIKVFTLVSALGFIGGILGLLIAVKTWLFGFRPKSPWGAIHRWSTGERKRSLLDGFQAKFSATNSGIPLVHPMKHRDSINDLGNIAPSELDDQRIHRVEDRIQMLEVLLKSYYIGDGWYQ